MRMLMRTGSALGVPGPRSQNQVRGLAPHPPAAATGESRLAFYQFGASTGHFRRSRHQVEEQAGAYGEPPLLEVRRRASLWRSAMRKLILISILIATVVIPVRAARHRSAR